MITTVVFDLDDTLYDEIDYCRSGFASVAEFLANLPGFANPERIFDCLWNQFTAGNRTKTFNAALAEIGLPPNTDEGDLIPRLIEVYRNHVPRLTLPPDSRQILTTLSSKYTLAMLTDGFLPAQKLKVRALQIEEFFKCIVYTEELGRQYWKPSPAGFEKIIRILNAAPQSIAYVADNEKKDFIAPNQLGFATVRLVRPARIHTESAPEPHATAGHLIEKIAELPALLDKL